MAVIVAVVLLVSSLGVAYYTGLIPRGASSQPSGGQKPQNVPVSGLLIYQPGGHNYSNAGSPTLDPLAEGSIGQQETPALLEASNGTVYQVLLGSLFASTVPLAAEGNFSLTPSTTPGLYDLTKYVVESPRSTLAVGHEVSLTATTLGVAAANLTLGFTTNTSVPVAYLAFGIYPTFFSNTSIQGVAVNASVLASLLDVDTGWLSGIAHSVDSSLPSSAPELVLVNGSIELDNIVSVRGQVQVIITPDNVSAFVASLNNSEGSVNTGMATSFMDMLNEELLGLSVVSVHHIDFYFILAPTELNRTSLSGLVTLQVEESAVSLALQPGTNPAISAAGASVSPILAVTWNQTPLSASGYAFSTVHGLWQVATDSAVSIQAAAVGISLNDAGSALQGMGYSEGQMVSDLATIQNPAVFVLVDPDIVANPNISAAQTSFALAIVPNDELSLQHAVSLYLTVEGVAYNMSYYLGGCGPSASVSGCPILVADTVGFGSPASYTPDQLAQLTRPTFVKTSGFLAGTTMKTVGQQMGGSDGFSELIQDSPIDIGIYDLGYSTGRVGWNLPSLYVTWGQGPTLEVTNNLTEGLYVPAGSVTSSWYLDNFDSFIGSSAIGWTSATVGMFESYTNDVRHLVSSTVFNGSAPVPGVLVMMDLWANNSPGQLLASVSGVGTQACVSILNLSSNLNCIVANLSLSANSASYVFPGFAEVSTSLSGNASASNLTTGSCVWIGSTPASCAYTILACLLAGLCSLSPYHVVNVTVYTCYVVTVGTVESCFPPLLLGSVGHSEVSYTLSWEWAPIYTSAPYAVSLSQEAGPSVVLAPPVYPNPLLPGIMDVGETVDFSAEATGGSGGYSYSWAGLPPGCASQDSATLSCTPSTSGTFSVYVSVTDSLGHVGESENVNFSVNSALSITSFTASPSTVDVGQVTTVSVQTAGGTSPLLYSYPGWPSICVPSNTSSFSCLAVISGYFTVNVTVTDATLATAKASTSITVNPLLTLIPTLSAPIVSISGTSLACLPYTCPTSTYVNVSVSGGTGPWTYAYSGLPPGCSSSNTSSLSCTPNSSSLTYCVVVCWGWYNITVTVTDSVGSVATTAVPLFLTVTSEPARFRQTQARKD